MGSRHHSTPEGMKDVAMRYFNGEADSAQERKLHDFLTQNTSGMEILREWETEWEMSGCRNQESVKEWARLSERISRSESARKKSLGRRRIFVRAVSIAAACVAVILSAGGIVGIVQSMSPAQYCSIEAPLGERAHVKLADGSSVWLNAGSSLIYSDRFSVWNRKVKLSGEGYFEITRHGGRPFIVETSSYDIKVTGTKFNVSSYPEDDFASVALTEGSVELLSDEMKIPMSAGETVTLDKDSGKFYRSHEPNGNSNSWIENRVAFDNITLDLLATKLSRQYNRRIFIESDTLRKRKFHISLRNNESIEEVLSALKDIIPITYEFVDKDIYIKEQQKDHK